LSSIRRWKRNMIAMIMIPWIWWDSLYSHQLCSCISCYNFKLFFSKEEEAAMIDKDYFDGFEKGMKPRGEYHCQKNSWYICYSIELHWTGHCLEVNDVVII
jgi:hypothetical protein